MACLGRVVAWHCEPCTQGLSTARRVRYIRSIKITLYRVKGLSEVRILRPQPWAGARLGPGATRATRHDGTDLQACEDRDAVRQGQHQGLGARLRAGDIARSRAADGVDQLR